jgi:hypothetical protein
MPSTPFCLRFLVITAFVLLSSGCGQSKPPAQSPPQPAQREHSTAPAKEAGIVSPENEPEQGDLNRTCRDERAIQDSERNRDACFHLQPGATTTKVVKQQVPGKTVKTSKTTKSSTKKGQKTVIKAPATTVTKVVQTTGRCQPQSLIYARCRTGFMTCRLGDTSPVQWFACAKKNNSTSSTPVVGSVIVLDVNTRRGMPTGHPAYVEAVKKNQDGTWTLRISHTNYDRKCHLDQDATVLFNPKHMTASFATGPWSTWAKDLKALGFILR